MEMINKNNYCSSDQEITRKPTYTKVRCIAEIQEKPSKCRIYKVSKQEFEKVALTKKKKKFLHAAAGADGTPSPRKQGQLIVATYFAGAGCALTLQLSIYLLFSLFY